MKVIDLFNKIANGEEPPEKIKFNGYEYSYHDKEHGYCRYNYDCIYICFDSEYYLFDVLNDEVEILEEEKKIPEKLEYYDDSIAWVIDNVGQLSDVDKVIIDKLNDVIDYLKSKGE